MSFSIPLARAVPMPRWDLGMLPVWEQDRGHGNGEMLTGTGTGPQKWADFQRNWEMTHGDQVMLMRAVGCPCWLHPDSRCSALSGPMSPCQNHVLHFWHPFLWYPRAPSSVLWFSPTLPVAAPAFPTNSAQSGAICRV